MQLSNIPGKLVLPFANAGGKSTIPVASQIGITAGAASLTDGFPPLTRTPIAAGGVPPSGLDMNGILYEMSAIIRWANAGGGYPFDGTFATDTNVGGYPKGARIMRSDGTGYWFNTVENNVTSPDEAGAAAAGWVPDFTSGAAAVTMTGSNVTLSPAQYGKPVIVITGVLTANLNLIFPSIVGEWIVINGTTGSYNITAKTLAGAGTSLFSKTPIFCDGLTMSSSLYDLSLSSGASMIGVTQIGTGAITRTLQDKARENISATDYATIQQAITAAGASGSVTIPASYPGTDAYTTDDNIPITDLRHKQTGFWSRIGPSYPVSKYPFGNDAVLLARGPADLYIEHFHVEATTTVTLNVGLNTNVPISAVTCGNKRFPADSGTGGAEMFSMSAQLVIGRETDNEEQVNQGSWSYVDATHINITCTKTHTGTTDIDQGGSTLLNSHDLFIGSHVVKPGQNTTYDAPLRLKDLGGRLIAKIPSNIDNALPHGAWQWGSMQTGMFGVHKHLYYQNALTTSKVIWRSAAGVEIVTINDSGELKALGGMAMGEGQMTLNGVYAEVKVGRNVDGRAITSPVDCHVVFQGGSDPLNPSLTAGSMLLASSIVNSAINFAPQNVWSGSLTVNGLKLKTGFGCNNKAPQAAKASGGTLAGVIAALVANGILSS